MSESAGYILKMRTGFQQCQSVVWTKQSLKNPIRKKRDEKEQSEGSFICCITVCKDRALMSPSGKFPVVPESLPGIINIAASLIKRQSGIASHSRSHLAGLCNSMCCIGCGY